jgi:hypothetical protein
MLELLWSFGAWSLVLFLEAVDPVQILRIG